MHPGTLHFYPFLFPGILDAATLTLSLCAASPRLNLTFNHRDIYEYFKVG